MFRKLVTPALAALVLFLSGCELAPRPIIEPTVMVRGSVGPFAQFSLHFDETDIITSDLVQSGHMVYYYDVLYPTPDAGFKSKGYTSFTHVNFQKTWDFGEGTYMKDFTATILCSASYKVTFYWCITPNVRDAETIEEIYDEYPYGPLLYLGSVKGNVLLQLSTPAADDGSIVHSVNLDGDDQFAWDRTFDDGAEVTADNEEWYNSTWKYYRNSWTTGARIRLDNGEWHELTNPNADTYIWPTIIASGDHTVDVQCSDEASHWGTIVQVEFTKP